MRHLNLYLTHMDILNTASRSLHQKVINTYTSPIPHSQASYTSGHLQHAGDLERYCNIMGTFPTLWVHPHNVLKYQQSQKRIPQGTLVLKL